MDPSFLIAKEMYQSFFGDKDEFDIDIFSKFLTLAQQQTSGTTDIAPAQDKSKTALENTDSQELTTVAPATQKAYGDKYFVLQNRLLNAITDLSLNERRLIMLLSPTVRQKIEEDPKTRDFYINVKDFVEHYNIKGKGYYEEMAKIATSILKKHFFYWDWRNDYKIKIGVNWVSSCEYLQQEGRLKIRLDDNVIEMLTIFDKHNPFTKIELQGITNLGSYGIVLYLLISSCLHQSIKIKKYSIGFLREQFNCTEKYPVFTDFKRCVLMSAIKDIESYTNLRINMYPVRTGRVVTDVSFEFYQIQKQEPVVAPSPPAIDDFTNLTDEERRIADEAEEFLLKMHPDATKAHIRNARNKAVRLVREAYKSAPAQAQSKTEHDTDTGLSQKEDKIDYEALFEAQLNHAKDFCHANFDLIKKSSSPTLATAFFNDKKYLLLMNLAKDTFCNPAYNHLFKKISDN